MLFLTKGKTNWKYILIVVVLAAIVGGEILGYLRYFKREIISLTKFPEIKKPEKPKIGEETADWVTYKNEEYGFEFKYPEGWYIEERSGDKVSTPWFTLFEVILNEKKLIEHERPLISIYIQNENFVLGTRDWQDFKVGQVDGKIACDVLGCEIIPSRIRNQTFYILTKNNPLFDTITNQMLSTFRSLE
jgi:hypothetical protein